ncbi:helix-turn-helix domain-containing protein [Streptomyces sp. PU-14G]|uniref:helix-turn-helix domain-containing protein n=1 Tax=Streptomyces sp. PU-14G TaxID=2800808 RepID=UPI0034DFE0D7
MGDPYQDLWTHPELAGSVARDDWGAALRTYRRLTGLSQTKLGERVGLAQSDVSEFERGRRRVTSLEVRNRLVDGLGIPPALLEQPTGEKALPVAGLRLPGAVPDDDMLDRVTGVVEGTHRADHATLDWLDRLLAQHRRSEDFIGSRPLVGVMREQLRTVVGMHAGASGGLADRIVRLAAEHAQFLAWMAQDQDDATSALTWYDRSHEWALEAGDADMAATTLNMKAHQAWSKGRARRCVQLAKASRWSAPGASLTVQGMAAQMIGRGHAQLGESDETHRLLDEAQELLSRAAARPSDGPAWLYFYDENWFTLQRGMACLHLRDWDAAIDHLTTGLYALPDAYRRDKTWYRACLAHAQAEADEPEQALHTALASTADAADIGRPHAWNELHATAAALTRRGTPHSSPLLAALRQHD